MHRNPSSPFVAKSVAREWQEPLPFEKQASAAIVSGGNCVLSRQRTEDMKYRNENSTDRSHDSLS
jgi:hypothetical protein